MKAFGLSSEVNCVLYHLRDLPAYPLYLEQLRWAQPANNSPNKKSKACTDHCVCPTLNPSLCDLCRLFTCSWPPLLWPSISDQSLLNSVLFSLPSLCWSVYGSEPWCCWRWSSPSSGGCVWPRGCGCCPGWQSCVGPSSFVWGFTLRQSCSVGPR